MRYAQIKTRAQLGFEAYPVVIEVHISSGLPSLSIVGLPETAIKESRDRVRSAIINSGFEFPKRRITINLAPADLPKREGGRFDLPIAIGILAASEQVRWPLLTDRYEFAGELGLDGSLRHFNGVINMAVVAQKLNRILVVPDDNLEELRLVPNLCYLAANSLSQLCQLIASSYSGIISDDFEKMKFSMDNIKKDGSPDVFDKKFETCNQDDIIHNSSSCIKRTDPNPCWPQDSVDSSIDLTDIYGQQEAKRALEIAAAGRHSLFMTGPPGVGKSMIAQRIITILPPISYNALLENAVIYSLHGSYHWHNGFQQIAQRPFRAPHHTVSTSALIGGSNPPIPGEISLANHGVLFLDELLEFSHKTLEALREPLENRQITISRTAHCAIFPCDFQLVVAMNPCPCGYYGDRFQQCRCSNEQIRNYHNRLSGPLADRIDLWLWVPALSAKILASDYLNSTLTSAESSMGENSATVRQRVIKAQHQALQRSGKLNSALSNQELQSCLRLTSEAKKFLSNRLEQGHLSARAYHRLLKVSRTIADLADSQQVDAEHIQEAFSYRNKLNILSPL